MSYRDTMNKFVNEARNLVDLKRTDVLTVFLANYAPQMVDMGITMDHLREENRRLQAIVDLIELKQQRDALTEAALEALTFVTAEEHGTINADTSYFAEHRQRAEAALRKALAGKIGSDERAHVDLSIVLGFLHVDGKAVTWSAPDGTYVEPKDLLEGEQYRLDIDAAILLRVDVLGDAL